MKRLKNMLLLLTLILGFSVSCNDFLDVKPKGSLSEFTYPETKDGAERLLIGAYSLLDGVGNQPVNPYFISSTNWTYGSIAGGDAHKGSQAFDQTSIDQIEMYNPVTANFYFDLRWSSIYEGVTRANEVLKLLKKVKDGTTADTTRIGAEARALRGIYHLEAKRMWNMVPFVSENDNPDVVKNETNIWPEIEADLLYAYNHAQANSPEVGRLNKWSAGAFYAKVLMYQSKYSLAKTVLEDIYANGANPAGIKYGLHDSFEDNFDPSKENGPESVFAIQFAVNDGSGGANARNGDGLNWPGGPPAGCCGFFQPSSELVNSYRTNASGLPLLDGAYNNDGNAVVDDQGIPSSDPFTEDDGNLDPRLDWTVGRRGIPYLGYGDHPGMMWIRDQSYGGPYSPKKNIYKEGQGEQYADQSNWAQSTAANYDMIRFAQVILWLAECEVEANNLSVARDYVNQIRTRAANPAGWVKNDDNTDAANYAVSPYPGSGAPFDTQENAKRAVHFETKLEFAMEGNRFFDLVRWGEAATTLNSYLEYEKTKRDYLRNATFTPGRNEYYPIPQHQIDLMGSDLLKQNPGY